MAIPAENFTVGKGITTATAYVMSFPFTSSFPTPITPYQFLITPNVVMIMSPPSALAFSACSSPCLLNNTIGECHFAPPCVGKDKYTTMERRVKCCESGRIGAWSKKSSYSLLFTLCSASLLACWKIGLWGRCWSKWKLKAFSSSFFFGYSPSY